MRTGITIAIAVVVLSAVALQLKSQAPIKRDDGGGTFGFRSVHEPILPAPEYDWLTDRADHTVTVDIMNPFFRHQCDLQIFEEFLARHPRNGSGFIQKVRGGPETFPGEHPAHTYFQLNRFYFEACSLRLIARHLFSHLVENRYLAYRCITECRAPDVREEFKLLGYEYWRTTHDLYPLRHRVNDLLIRVGEK
jgi:hypothetical protein